MGEIGQGPAEGWTDQGQPRPKQGSTSDSTSGSTWKVDVEGRCGSSVGKLGLECRLANSAWKVDLARGMVVARLGLPRPPVLGQLPARSRRALLGDGSPCLATAAGAGTNEKSPKVNKQLAQDGDVNDAGVGLGLVGVLGVLRRVSTRPEPAKTRPTKARPAKVQPRADQGPAKGQPRVNRPGPSKGRPRPDHSGQPGVIPALY